VKHLRPLLLMMLMTMPLWAASRLGTYTGVVAQVPFEFVVGGRIIPAGQCIVQPATLAEETMLIRNLDAKVDAFTRASTVETGKVAGANALVFHKYGERYFLSAIQLEGTRTIYEMPESRAEAEMKAQKVPSVEKTVFTNLQ
jgi:hypothetical protein